MSSVSTAARRLGSRWKALGREPEFSKFWAAQAISEMGSQVSLLAIPLTVVLVLSGGAWQTGVLAAAERAPFIIFGLIAGVLIERLRRRPVLIAADLGRAAALAWIPIGDALHLLATWQLYLVAFVVGSLTVFFDITYQTYVPLLVGRDALIRANSRLTFTESTAQLLGPGLGGLLVRLLTAPVAVAADSVSFVFSAALFTAIRRPESRSSASLGLASMRADLAAGLRVVARNPFLRWNAVTGALGNVLINALFAILFVYLLTDLHVGVTGTVIVVAVGSAGALAGLTVIKLLNKAVGFGLTVIIATATAAIGAGFIAAAGGGPVAATVLASLGDFVIFFGVPIFNVNVITMRQLITPDYLLARVNGTMRFLIWGTMPIGSLLGGFLGAQFGVRLTITILSVLLLLPTAVLLISPIRAIRDRSDCPPIDSDMTSKEVTV